MNFFSLKSLLTLCFVLNAVVGQYPNTEEEKDKTKFREECLKIHNNYRNRHQSPPMVLDEKINLWAQDWAEDNADRDIMEHRSNNPYGENLYMFGPSPAPQGPNPQDVVSAWYDEIEYYDFNYGGFSGATGHFTQVVWKNSTKLGCGWARSYSDNIYVVCNYDPPGNYMGKFQENVLYPIN
ncbi:Golgi-associated plant pathogenesis-related protein 1-like [Ixodes scapularis]|uniref:Golgi-associated plant pathogenesis-related protein 1-like n=1 Tax=Ixodes scapularis TaxID=6945 RepID=UPI001A9D0272|nr:Golgi-associated plant pathogenesis-related protein 1-like [Ixodes scapularis]